MQNEKLVVYEVTIQKVKSFDSKKSDETSSQPQTDVSRNQSHFEDTEDERGLIS